MHKACAQLLGKSGCIERTPLTSNEYPNPPPAGCLSKKPVFRDPDLKNAECCRVPLLGTCHRPVGHMDVVSLHSNESTACCLIFLGFRRFDRHGFIEIAELRPNGSRVNPEIRNGEITPDTHQKHSVDVLLRSLCCLPSTSVPCHTGLKQYRTDSSWLGKESEARLMGMRVNGHAGFAATMQSRRVHSIASISTDSE